MKNKKPFKSIQLTLMLPFAVVGIIFAIITGLFAHNFMFHILQERTKNQATAISTAIDQLTLITGSTSQLSRFISMIGSERNVKKVSIIQGNNIVFSSRNSEVGDAINDQHMLSEIELVNKQGVDFFELHTEENIAELITPVRVRESNHLQDKRSTLIVEMDIKKERLSAIQQAWTITTIMIFALGLLMFFTYRLIVKYIFSPIGHIQTAITARQEGNYTLAHIERMDEIGNVAETYNHLIQDFSSKGAELEKALIKAEEGTRLKSEFLANMSHEIRTPMNGILGVAHLLNDTKLSAKQKSFVETIEKSGEALLYLINDILDLSKIEAGKIEIEHAPFNLLKTIEDTVDIITPKCRDKNIQTIINVPPNLPTSLIGDSGRVRQVLLNLLSNAVKFTHEGYVTINVDALTLENGHIRFEISVIDTGIGIPENKISHIFNKFDQADASTTREFGGTGLGLSISQKLCHMMGGDISVESTEGVGSAFTAYIEMQVDGDPKEEDRYSHLKDYDISETSVLIADNLEIINIGLCTLFKQHNVTCYTAHDKDSFFKTLETKDIDVVLIGERLSGIRAKDILLQARKGSEKSPNFVFMTNTPAEYDKNDMKAAGFIAFFPKPIYPSELIPLLKDIKKQRTEKTGNFIITRHSLKERRKTPRDENKAPHKAKVLLAEDNPVNRGIANAMLEKIGCTVKLATNGAEAIQAYEEGSFDLIFMDCQMPEVDGFEATKSIRSLEGSKASNRTPIIAFTANAMSGDKDICLEAGMDDYISKPAKPKDFEEKINKWFTAAHYEAMRKSE